MFGAPRTRRSHGREPRDTTRKKPIARAKRAPARKAPPGLVGRCFVTWVDGRKVQRQGRVVAELLDGYYLVQVYSWIMGEPSTMAVVHVSDLATKRLDDVGSPGTVEFFEDDEHLRFWFEYGGGRHATHGDD